MKHLLVFGATGGTGSEVVKQAISKGFLVTVIVRDPSAIALRHPALTICKGDVMQPLTFENEVAGKTAIISCLGTGNSLKATRIYSQGIENIINAMEAAQVTRLICISAGALYTNCEMGFFTRIFAASVLQRILRNVYADMRLMERIVEESDINWSIVRPPMLTDKNFTGRYRTAVNAHVKRPFSIARADLAHYLLSVVNNPDTFKSILEIAY